VEGFPSAPGRAILIQPEVEFRAQIETVLAAGLKPAHPDWHALHLDGKADRWGLRFRLAKEYGLAFRVTGRPFIQQVQSLNLPANGHNLPDSFTLDPVHKADRYAQLLRALPSGLSGWAVHPGFDNPELLAREPDGNHVRQTDYDFHSQKKPFFRNCSASRPTTFLRRACRYQYKPL
jgi:hypothetical protein